MAIEDYSTTPSSNNKAAPNGWPETTMTIKQLNDSGRQLMADVRETFEGNGFVQLHDDGTKNHTVTYQSGTKVQFSGDQSALYKEGQRIKVEGSATGTIYGTIEYVSATANTDVTIQWESGSLSNETLTASVGIAERYATATPMLAVPTAKSTNYTVTPGDHGRTVPVGTSTLTVTLPLVTAVPDGFWVELLLLSTHKITVSASGANTIKGVSSVYMEAPYDSMVLKSNGNSWYIPQDNRAMQAYAYGTATTLPSAGTLTKVALTAFRALPNATTPYGFTIASNLVTVHEPGIYRMWGQVALGDSVDDFLTLRGVIEYNGATIIQSYNRIIGDGSSGMQAPYTPIPAISTYCANGDTIGLWASIGNQSTSKDTSGSATDLFLGVERVK